MSNEKSWYEENIQPCLDEINRRQKENDFPTCPKCGSVVTHMFHAEGDYDPTLKKNVVRVVFVCGSCNDPHYNRWADGVLDGPTEFCIVNGEKILVTPGASEFA